MSTSSSSAVNETTASAVVASDALTRVGAALDDAMLRQRSRVVELEDTIEFQLDELSRVLESGKSDLELRETALLRRAETVETRLREAIRRESQTRQQRRQAARQLCARKAEQDAELQLARLTLKDQRPSGETPPTEDGQESPPASAAPQVRMLQGRIDQLEAELERRGESADPDPESLRAELEIQRSLSDEALNIASQLKEKLRSLESVSQRDPDQQKQQQSELHQLKQDKQLLAEKLEEAVSQLETTSNSNQDDLRRRFEMAVQDIRELKEENEQLRLELQSSEAPGAAPRVENGSDWESQKARMLAQLDAEMSDGDATAKAARMTIEGTINITDQVIAEKDREIRELQMLLEQQSQAVGDVAVGSAAIVALLEQDELIQQERDNLRRIQEEWREKLRASEIEISVERAKLARGRAELDERIRVLESERGADADKEGAGKEHGRKKSPRRRWMSRLGLTDDE